MSDEDFYSEESYEFEFEEDEEEVDENDGVIDQDEDEPMENKYYSAKSSKDDDVNLAITHFKEIIRSTYSKDETEWIFKSYKQLMKMELKSSNYQKILNLLKEALKLIPKLQKPYIEESISKMILRFTNVSDVDFVNEFFQILLSQSELNSDRIWMKINCSLLNFYLENKVSFDKVPELIESLFQRLENCPESIQKSFTLDIIAAEIEYYSKINLLKLPRMNQLYRMSLQVTTAVTHPRILGIIKECGGKVHFYRENFEKARLEFYESFKSYDEAGSSLKNKLLKYLALCSILSENELDPFESQETQTYAQSEEFETLKSLIKAYNNLSLNEFNRILKHDDPFYKDDIFAYASQKILLNLKTKLILNHTKAYSTLRFEYLYGVLQIDNSNLEKLLTKLIFNGKLKNIKVDFVEKIIYKTEQNDLPISVIPKMIYQNLKSLESLNPSRNDDSMDVDNEEDLLLNKHQDASLLNNLFFLIDRPNNPKDWFSSIENWYLFVMSSLPPLHKSEISQKDQVYIEQRQIQVNADSKVERELANFNTGLLSGIVNAKDEDDEIEITNIKKVHLLQAWIEALKSEK